jgi:hypothetical protein
MAVSDLVGALWEIGGEAAVGRLSFAPVAEIVAIVKGWPVRFSAARSQRLGFSADAGARQIIADFVADELGGAVSR